MVRESADFPAASALHTPVPAPIYWRVLKTTPQTRRHLVSRRWRRADQRLLDRFAAGRNSLDELPVHQASGVEA